MKSSQHLLTLPWEQCNDDAETSAFNFNIRLFMFKNIIFDYRHLCQLTVMTEIFLLRFFSCKNENHVMMPQIKFSICLII